MKKRYPKHVIIASLMTETKEDWRVLIQKCEDAGVDGLELNFGCPHGMCERGMGSVGRTRAKAPRRDHELDEGVRADCRFS